MPSPRSRMRLLAGATGAVLGLSLLTACGDDGPSLVIYNAQHEQLIDEVAKQFTEDTGIELQMRDGSDLELANQIVAEGDASPADVFLTENSPGMSLVDSKGLLASLDQGTLDMIPAEYRPTDGDWTGFAARSTVMVYNTDTMTEADMPESLLDLADPEWKDRISFSPTGADFQAIVSAVLATEGEDATREWLAGLKENGTIYDGNNVVLKSVNSGEVDAGVIYHYYWYRDQEESGADSDNSALHFFGDQDPGAFLSVSGAGVLASSDDAADAQKFVEYLTSPAGQQIIADSYALEYTLNPEVPLDRDVMPLADLEPPTVDVASLNGPQVVDLMEEAGFL
ncbi:iron ABC transporter substrate-binding protein [Nocardioides salsibiostraticola]